MSDATVHAPVVGSPSPIVVGIGASAGGLEAATQLLSHLPDGLGMAFVLVQHLDPAHPSELAKLLAKTTRLPVSEVADGMAISSDHVYVIPPNTNLAIAGGVLHLTPRGDTKRVHLPVDTFFRSLAQECQSRAIGVVLSGTGSDGSLGLAEIKAAGGITFAQDEDSAEYASMPQSAIATGHVDVVLSPMQIAAELSRMGEHPYLRSAATTEAGAGQEFGRILAHLRSVTGVDFSEYRDTTIKRRIARRMAVHQQQSLSEYSRFLRANPTEISALYQDMLINVTSFFRDADVFESLKRTVFPEIVQGKSAENPVRIWVPGCSTGQEAYSLAMLMLEFLDQQAQRPPVQIFGTDVNDAAAVEKARPGIYPPSIEAEVTPERLQRFFVKVDSGYRISKSIRDLCVFARQDLAADPPFSRMDLISCRNVLIYLSPSLQQRIMPSFHYALRPGGFLLLGPSETIGRFTDLFERVDPGHQVFRRKAAMTRPHAPSFGSPRPRPPASAPAMAHAPSLLDLRREADRMILARFAPASVLVDDKLEILQFRGATAPYLQPPSGQPTHDLLKMVRDSLFMEVRDVMADVRQHNSTARRENVRLQDGNEMRLVNLEASPVRLQGVPQGCFLLLFMEAAPPSSAAPAPSATPSEREARENSDLRQELAGVKEYLQAVIEQQNAANEELQSANEEVRSANEELQGTNEEMQTGKEELQSTNEELHTVNSELQARNLEISQLSDDFSNILASMKLPIVMLDPALRIRRFTASAASLFNLLPTDRGRPFSDIKLPFELPDLQRSMLDVIAAVAPAQQETQDHAGHWYQLSLHPYRTDDNRIDGVVLVLVDVDQDKRTKEQLRRSAKAKDEFLAVLSHELRTPLSPILATAAMLRDDLRLDSDTREQLDVICRNVELEAQLIDDLLDVTRIERGKLELDRRPVDLCTVIGRAVEVCRADIVARKLQFGVDFGPTPSYMVHADPGRLQQVFWNVLKNAVKFTPVGGHVGIRCRIDAHGHAVTEISDSGEGIDAAVLPRLFRAFEQGERKITRQFGGLGLGLTISRAMVELHGGSIRAHSDGRGKGATFTIRLPVLPPSEPAAPGGTSVQGQDSSGAVPAAPRKLRILLVEDHGDTARIMHRLLSASGSHVETVGDVAGALRAIDTQPFDLLLSDLGLPDASGLELMRAIRAKGLALPGIALSGYGQDKDVQASREAGFAAHLVKPVLLPKLHEVIARVIDVV